MENPGPHSGFPAVLERSRNCGLHLDRARPLSPLSAHVVLEAHLPQLADQSLKGG